VTIQIDIKTRVFDEDEIAYRLFPGQGYRHFRTMKDYSVVFLDNPGIIRPTAVGYGKNDETLVSIARSEAKQSIVASKSKGMSAELAAVDAKDFGDVRWGAKRELNLGWLNALYFRARLGDLVILPSPAAVKNEAGEYEPSHTLIGEIVGELERWTERGPENILAGRYLIRRVKWLASVKESELEPKTQNALRTQNALTAIRARSFERAIGAAYNNVLIGNEFLARFSTLDEDFTAFESYHFNAFIMTVVAACRSVENQSGPWRDGESIYDIAARVRRQDKLVPEQESSIHSPGYFTLRGKVMVPAVLSSLFALASAVAADPSMDPFSGAGPGQVSVVNSGSAALDPCDVGIDQTVREALTIMGYDRWKQMCEAAQNASQDDGLRSVTTVQRRPDGD
jgi:hypothetical protein